MGFHLTQVVVVTTFLPRILATKNVAVITVIGILIMAVIGGGAMKLAIFIHPIENVTLLESLRQFDASMSGNYNKL
jgi:hypothetical protein